MKKSPVYLDNNATTMVAPEVVDAMLPYLREHYGNPSSPHGFARAPALAVAKAREQVARLVGVPAEKLVFTSGGTEGNAMALLGLLPAQKPRKEIILSAVEHASIWAWRDRLTEMGYKVHVLPVDRNGALDLGAFESLLSDDTALVSIMMANNETGVIYPIKRVVELAHKAGAKVHSDAIQVIGKAPVNFEEIGVDSASLCGHKYHGSKGIGCLYIKNISKFVPLLYGGEQEFGRRPGTEAVSSIAALGAASDLAFDWLHGKGPGVMASMRDEFEKQIETKVKDLDIIGNGGPRLANTSMLLIQGLETEPLLALLDMEGVACSSGSACASGAHEPSHVLKAMDIDLENAAVLRISASRYTVPDDYERLLNILPDIIQRLRS